MSIPRHIAIIMDGNRRWADKRGLSHIEGHAEGVRSLDVITEECARKGVEALTVYGFSSENWARPKEAVNSLFALMHKSIDKYMDKVKANNIRARVIGRIDGIPQPLRGALKRAVKDTMGNSGMTVVLALNYGGRQEILDAVNSFLGARESSGGSGPDVILEKDIEEKLYTAGLPDPDLVIRTSGEVRLSNFLMWQSAYAELYFTETLWPDFRVAELGKALDEYAGRQRRFGE